MNRTPDPSTGISPEKLITGKEPESMFEGLPSTAEIPGQAEIDERKLVFENLQKRAEERMKRVKRSKKLWNIQIGERVLAREHHLSSSLKGRNHKLELLYSHPRVVTQKFCHDTFELADETTGKITGRFHKSRLKRLVPQGNEPGPAARD